MIKKNLRFAKDCISDIAALPFYLRKSEKSTDEIRERCIRYAINQGIDGVRFRFSNSAREASLFSSVYWLLILGLSGKQISDNEVWFEYLNSFQDDDGIWRDKEHPFRNWPHRDDEWNDIHLISHIIYAYEIIDRKPIKQFSFLDKFKDIDYTKEFCNRIDFERFWGDSNGVMNYLVAMIYDRDIMGDRGFQPCIEFIIGFLKHRFDETDGIWTKNKDKTSLYEAVRGGYHVWMLMIQEGVNFEEKHIKNIIDTILSLQNKLGGFNNRIIADTCHNIDCIDPLVRFSLMLPEYRKREVRESLLKARRYLINNMNDDGGFCFRRMHKLYYGNDSLVSNINKSNLFGTWFTLLAVIVIDDFFNNDTILKSELPGMEYRIKRTY